MTRIITTLCGVAIAALLTSCVSPLDTDAPRKETPLTPGVKITPSSYAVEFSGASAAYRIKGLPTFKFDTTVSPIRCWLDVTMDADPSVTPKPMLQEFRMRLDSFPSDGLIANLVKGEVNFLADFGSGVQNFPCEPNTNTASIIIAERPRNPGEKRQITVTMYFVMNKDNYFVGVPKEYPFGKIELEL